MKNKKLHYIGYCVAKNETQDYVCNIASGLKMHYIANVAARAGFNVGMLSMCTTTKRYSGAKTNKSESIPITHIASFGEKGALSKVLNRILFFLQFAIYLLFFVKKDDTVLLYHSIKLSKMFLTLSKIKKVSVVLEVEEIYAYSAEGIRPYEHKELKCIKSFDKFIFVNDYIPQYLNIEKDKYIVIYGSYIPASSTAEHFADDKHHIVYAGAIETLNKGAFTAIQAARFLPDNYMVHILGKGSKENLQKAQKEIAEINKEREIELVRYEGFMSGQQLSDFLCRCDVGVGTYQIKEMYSDFVFPSKLVSYMCHDLSVVTGRSICYEQALIAEDWFFYNENTFEDIADAIIKASVSEKRSSVELIKELDSRVVCSFRCLYKNGVWGKQ